MKWTTVMTAKARKQMSRLPEKYRKIFEALLSEIVVFGPVRNSWPNYGRIRGSKCCHHCHLNKGRPRYVAVWSVVDDQIQIIEVRYVGTHEKADYKRVC